MERRRFGRLTLLDRGWLQLRSRLLLRWLRRQQGSPGYVARGLAAGVFTGCLPFFGLQIVLGVALAGLMRGHPLLAAAGTWISNPLTNLPLFWINLQVGVLLLGPVEALAIDGFADVAALAERRDLGWALGMRLLLGSLLMGLAAAVVCGLGSWWLLRRKAPG